MNQEHPWLRIGTLFTSIVVVLVILALAGGVPAATETASAQTIPTDRPRPDPTRRPPDRPPVPTRRPPDRPPAQATAVGGGTAVTTPVAVTPVPSGGGRCEVVVTDDDGVSPGRVEVIEVRVEDLPNRDRRYTYIRACDIVYRDETGTIVPSKVFNGPIESCFLLTPEDIARAGGNPQRLTVLVYDPVSGTWQQLPVVIDPTNSRICAQQPISGILALALPAGSSTLPGTSGEIPEGQAAAPAAADANAPAAAPAAADANAPAAAPANANAPAAAPAPASANAPAAAPAAANAPAAPATSSPGPVLALILGVAAAIFAVILVLSHNLLSRSRDK